MKRIPILICIVLLATPAWAVRIFIPMSAKEQTNHLKAYGIAFAALTEHIPVSWLLNYKGGSFVIDDEGYIKQLCKTRGVNYTELTNKEYNRLTDNINDPDADYEIIKLEKAPRIAVYTPPNKEPWDDAVTLALTYAEIPFDKIYADEVLAGALDKYDWLHLHHEDFTGQYGKFWMGFHTAEWYRNDQQAAEALAAKNGFAKVSQMQLAVVKKMRAFVANGGNLFAMCSATETFDIALAAEHTDICETVFDGDPAEPGGQDKLDFTNCLAFKNFRVSTNPMEYVHSTIDNTYFRHVPDTADYFTLLKTPARMDPVPAMLCQNHTRIIKGFMGQTTAFNNTVLKANVQVLAECKQAGEARYIHGEYGKGSWTFYGGHDPEDYRHVVGAAPTDLSLHPSSPGYRLILNNVLFPAAKTRAVPTVVLNTKADGEPLPTPVEQLNLNHFKIQPNPSNNELLVSFNPAASPTNGKIKSIVIMNNAGEEIFSKVYNTATASIDLSDIPEGIYLIKVNGEYAGKIVKN